MYEIEITTPKGIIKFNLEILEKLAEKLEEHKGYTEVKARHIPETNGNRVNLKIKQKVV